MSLYPTKAFFLLSLCCSFTTLTAAEPWTEIQARSGNSLVRGSQSQHRLLRLNLPQLEQLVQSGKVTLPRIDAGSREFILQNSGALSTEMSAQYPSIRTFSGVATDGSGEQLRLDISPNGLRAMILGNNGAEVIEPSGPNMDIYRSTRLADLTTGEPVMRSCKVGAHPQVNLKPAPVRTAAVGDVTSHQQLKVYRLAVAATAEYSAAKGVTNEKVTANIVSMVNKFNAIYERDLSIRFMVVKTYVFSTPGTPFNDVDAAGALAINQKMMDADLGAGNYDLGHVFSLNANTGLGVFDGLCNNDNKGQGISPAGSYGENETLFATDMVAHEIGHQLNAEHTFNSICSSNRAESGRSETSSFEVGSGVTIMAYPGICGISEGTTVQNVAGQGNGFFHTGSIRSMLALIATRPGCERPAAGPEKNTPPTVTVQDTYTIPALTPFALTAQATDADEQDKDKLTYSWEQIDLVKAGTPSDEESTRPLFRNYQASSSPTRLFPSLAFLLNNQNQPPLTNKVDDVEYLTGETLPSTDRKLKFRVTVRDNRTSTDVVAGTTGFADTSVTVVSKSGPFQVTGLAKDTTWAAGSSQAVTWNVAGTSADPINCQNVNIRLSIDGGKTFPVLLAEGVANSGFAQVAIPQTVAATTKARISVEAVGNIFFDYSDFDFNITN